MPLSPGTKAPDFSLPFKPKEDPVRLADFRGDRKVVLLFFPLAFSGTCTEEMCAVADNYGAWQDLGAQVLGISIDSPYVNARFAEDIGAPFPILSDFNKEVAPEYDALHESLGDLKGVTRRVVYVIDEEGTITYVWEGEHPGVFPPLDEVMEAVRRA